MGTAVRPRMLARNSSQRPPLQSVFPMVEIPSGGEVMNWVLDTALNVLALGVLIAATFHSFVRGRQSYSVWHDKAPWLRHLMGTLFAGSTLAFMMVIYWLGYRWVGFPSWMRWVVENF
jgi:hypothetical protein